ncbi:SusC/RagA family TonB-linked outer membrane protein [Aestuariibaculum sp. M13]|uniref:SusC/RagA family TonB-linked outer membrane protein n=1 Tax=Aestuariibaculum sp. M13 TaxID=2967132 RepID=UPI00215A017B|nr:SusC/RagA family TonB-linked outer membrane protein [Aestuariibaculum sp. M13]MCR8666629.1 SusC/RagA family TonB-linked outer membrane protein [Aestuariibaculum sp. M13]
MKTKFSGILTLLLAFVVQLTFAQEKTISGVVSDNSGLPLPGATVLVKGTATGTSTDFDGKYAIEANQGATLVFSFVGYASQEITVGASNTINITLSEDAAALEEVVVTALGIQREKKSLGYAAQEVKGDAVSTVKDINFVNSLSGKVAGIDIQNTGTMGGSSNVVIRGYSSLYGSNQALFVVDGVPISNINSNTSTQRAGGAGYDYGNAAADINPDNIESINVLKGGAATALYGSQAANGVIVITTKKGKQSNGIGVTVNSSVTFNKYNKDTFAKYQKEYGAGYWIGVYHDDFYYDDQNGNGDEPYVLADWDGSYGAAFDPNRLVYQWDSFYPQLSDTYGVATPWVAGQHDPSYVFETGATIFNSVFLNGGGEKGTFKLGYTKSDQEGILPNSKIKRDNIDFSASYKLTDKLTATANASYIKTSGKGRYGTGYDGQNFMQTSRQWWQTNVDMKAQKEAYMATGDNITWNTSYINYDLHPIYHDNFYWMRYNNYETDLRNRVLGNVNLNYEVNDWLNIFARATLDTYSGNQEERINNGSTSSPSSYSIFNENYTQNTYDFQLQVDKDLSEKLNLKGILGTNIQRNHYSTLLASTNGGINIDGLWSLSNSANALSAPTQVEYTSGVDGYFANVSLGFDNLLFVEGSYRYDVASTLPQNDNGYDYYGISGSFLFSELIDSKFMNLGKLRLGYAKTGNAASALTLYNTFDLNTPVQGEASASLPSTNNNSNLKNEESKEKEIGLEMMFANKRLGFDFSLYDKTSSDLLTNISVTPAIGYTGQWINAGELQNKGIELSLWGSPVKTADFEWRVDVNWAKNKSTVLALPAGLTNLQLASLQEGSINATVGEPYGMIRGSNFVFDDNGNRMINPANGRYLVTDSEDENLGTFQPDWKGGINNSFTYKSLSFSFLIDVKHGGNVFSLDTWYGMATGLYPETAGLNELGNPKRDALTDDASSGGIILPGVLQTGTDADGNPTSDGTPNNVRTSMSNFANALGYTRAPTALHVYDASFVKLRQVSLTYSLPQNLLKDTFIQSASISAIGRNLWIIDKNIPYSDPEAGLSSGNVQGYQSGAYPSTKDYGFSVKLQF